MKQALALSLMILVPQFAQAETMLYCHAAGKTEGITSLFAKVRDGQIVSVAIRGLEAKTHRSDGSFETGFEVLKTNRAWRGIDVVSLVNENGRYSLKTENKCNFSYQEETCQDGDVLDTSSDFEIECRLVTLD